MNRRRRLQFLTCKKDNLIIYTTSVTPATFDPSWAGGTIIVNWGDGTPTESHTTGLSHTYAVPGTKRVEFSCADWTKITILDVNTDNCIASIPNFSRLSGLINWTAYANSLSGIIPSFATCTKLANWYAYSNSLTGVIPSFAACVNLLNWQVSYNQLSGIIPSFAACTKLVNWYVHTNQLSGYTVGSFATQKSLATLKLDTNLLPQASIDAILADLVTSLGISGRVACSVNLSSPSAYPNGNAIPSAAGLADKATLAAVSGWVVTTNV
jgi:hypothetical protein